MRWCLFGDLGLLCLEILMTRKNRYHHKDFVQISSISSYFQKNTVATPKQKTKQIEDMLELWYPKVSEIKKASWLRNIRDCSIYCNIWKSSNDLLQTADRMDVKRQICRVDFHNSFVVQLLHSWPRRRRRRRTFAE